MLLNIDLYISLLKSYSYHGNSGWQYFVAICIFASITLGLYIFRKIVLLRLKKLSAKTENKLDDILTATLESIGPFSYPVFALYLSLYYLNLPSNYTKVFSIVFIFVLASEFIKAFGTIFDFYLSKKIRGLEEESEKQGTRSVMQIIKVIVKAILWVIVLLMILSNLGINVTSMVASLGIGGLAVALALQNVLSDLLSSFSIYIDKPFAVGDFIVIGTDKGTVEKIGLKTTRIRNITGDELIISNKELTSARINNFKRLQKRRDSISIGVDYATDIKKLRQIPKIIEEIIVGEKKAEFSRCHLSSLDPSDLNYTTVYFVDSADYDVFSAVKQEILFKIVDKLKKEKIEFAYPTQEIILKK